MKLSKFLKYDIKEYLKTHSIVYVSFLIVFLLGILIGVINSLSSDNYLKVLTKDNKILYSFINGSIKAGSVFWKYLWNLFLPLLLISLLGLNFYLSLLSYVLIAYQSSIFTMSIFAIISTYGFSGVLNVLFIIFPINIIYILTLVVFASENIIRSYQANKSKIFSYNYKSREFIFVTIISVCFVILICFVGLVIIPLFLKNAIFLIF